MPTPVHARNLAVAAATALLLASAGCAQHSGKGSVNGSSRALEGTFTPMLSSTGNIGAAQQRLYGTVRLTAVPTRASYGVTLSISSPRGAENLAWTILDGRCGSSSLPLVQPKSLPPLEVRGTGVGELNTEIAVTLPAGGQYHVNLYVPGGSHLEEVVACANLRSA